MAFLQVAEKFIEAMHGGQELIPVTEVVFPELACRITQRLQDGRNGGVLLLQSLWRAWKTDFRHAGPERDLSRDEGGASGGATLLSVVIGQERAPSQASLSILGVR